MTSLITIAIIVFVLQNFTTLNIITSGNFLGKKLKSYPYMEAGASSKKLYFRAY